MHSVYVRLEIPFVYAHLRLILITFYVPALASAGCFHIFIRFVVKVNAREL